MVSLKSDALHGVVKESVYAAGIEELDDSAIEDSSSSGSEGGNEQNKKVMPIEVLTRANIPSETSRL
jgi:hypothetical protein